jgi:hypothetical protein
MLVQNFNNLKFKNMSLEREVLLQEARNYHKDLIKDLHLDEKDFTIKKVFRHEGKIVVPIMGYEFTKPKGLYFEVVSNDYSGFADENRTVYRLPNSEKEEAIPDRIYPDRYLVPLEVLRVVDPHSVAISKSAAVTSSDDVLKKYKSETSQPSSATVKIFSTKTVEDAPYTDMTIRDYITIHTGKPVSSKQWLNELIKTI